MCKTCSRVASAKLCPPIGDFGDGIIPAKVPDACTSSTRLSYFLNTSWGALHGEQVLIAFAYPGGYMIPELILPGVFV